MKNVIVIVVFLIIGCETKPNQVVVFGKLKDIMRKGDLTSKFDVRQLNGKSSIYAIGAAENLKGEIVISDGLMYHSSVNENDVINSSNFNIGAALFAYASIPKWTSYQHTDTLDMNQIENYFTDILKEYSLEQPFFFKIEGQFGKIDWHVIDTPSQKSGASHADHKSAGVSQISENVPYQIIGTYSSKHQHILSHGGSNIHLHALIDGKAIHVDDLVLLGPFTIYIPDKQ
jgi:acetolactate decarboxylase